MDLPYVLNRNPRGDIHSRVFFWPDSENRLIISGHEIVDQRAGPEGGVTIRLLEKHDMIKEIKGQISAGSGRYAIVVSRFNEFITSKLLGADVLLSDRCCGESGTFAISRPDIATQVRYRKQEELFKNIETLTGKPGKAEELKILTSCPLTNKVEMSVFLYVSPCLVSFIKRMV